MTRACSWLFVPADSEKKIGKAIESEADAVIFDLEDSVAPAQKATARQDSERPRQAHRRSAMVGAHQSAAHRELRKDLEMLGIAGIHGVVLPKAESGADIAELAHRTGNIPIHAIVTETAASLFGLLSYRDPKTTLAAMSWGAEDLSAALGASSKYDADGAASATPTSWLVHSALRERWRQEFNPWTASSPTSVTMRASAPKPKPRRAKASPASSRSILLRSA